MVHVPVGASRWGDPRGRESSRCLSLPSAFAELDWFVNDGATPSGCGRLTFLDSQFLRPLDADWIC